jgi:hypothetical protein
MDSYPLIAPAPGQLPPALTGHSVARQPRKNAAPDGSLITLARLLGRRAAREALQSSSGSAVAGSREVAP